MRIHETTAIPLMLPRQPSSEEDWEREGKVKRSSWKYEVAFSRSRRRKLRLTAVSIMLVTCLLYG